MTSIWHAVTFHMTRRRGAGKRIWFFFHHDNPIIIFGFVLSTDFANYLYFLKIYIMLFKEPGARTATPIHREATNFEICI